MISLEGKIALITGAASGIGLAITSQLLAAKVHVIAIDYNESALQSLAAYAEEHDYNLTAVQLDITNEPKIKELSLILQERFGKIDILIANAAILGDVTPLHHYNSKLWQKVINTNVTANFCLIKYFHHLLLKARSPQVIFVSCRMSEKNQAYWGAYLVSKVALQSLAQIYIEENNNSAIKVNVVDPGVTDTMLRKQAFPEKKKHLINTPDQAARIFLYCLTQNHVEHGNFLCYNANNEVELIQKLKWN